MEWKTIELKIKTFEDLKQEKAKIFGNSGPLAILLAELKEQIKSAKNPEEKAKLGKKVNELKEEAQEFFARMAKKVEKAEIEKKIATMWVDVTLPVNSQVSLHPITKVANLMNDWFIQNGYYHDISSETESDEYNFTKLNIPVDHPARAMHDSFYINKNHLLKTHNTAGTARLLEQMKGQHFSAFTIGKVYRNDPDDASHSHQFTQCDFVSVGDVSFANLKWTLNSLISHVFEKKVKTRIRPSYFPFTEPSLELDIYFKGRWIEILGAGMLHENVFKAAGIKKPMKGFAAGLGIERIVMIKYGISDIRYLYENNLQFLNQFKGVK